MRRSTSKRRCRECHAPATHVEVAQRPAAILHLDGTIDRFIEATSVYWCAGHTGLRPPHIRSLTDSDGAGG